MKILKWKRNLELDYGYTTNKLLVVGDTSRDISKVIEDYTLINEAGVDYILRQIPGVGWGRTGGLM